MLKTRVKAALLRNCHAIAAPSVLDIPLTGRSMATKRIPNLSPPSKPRYVTEFPERRRLRQFEKVPNVTHYQRGTIKMTKRVIDMRGPELVHNNLYLKQFGIRALQGGRMHYGHCEMVRQGINRKIDDSRMFAIWRIDPPWKPVFSKGQGHRMGGGKGNPHHYVTPVRSGRIIVEIGGNCEFVEIFPILRRVAQKLPFRAEVVDQAMMEETKEEEKRLQKENLNPFTFKYCVQNNILGCSKWLSPYDYKWYGKYR